MRSQDGKAETTALSAALRRSISGFVRATRKQVDTLPQSRAETLGELARWGPQSMAALAASRGVSHQTVSRMVAEMELLGLVTRKPDPHDARSYLIEVSTAGRDRVELDRRAREDRISSAIAACLTHEERQTLKQLPALLDRLTADIIDSGADGSDR